MRRILLAFLFLLFTSTSISYAAPTKTVAEVCNWTNIAANTTYQTSAVDLTGVYDATLQLDACLVSATATTNGLHIIVSTSSKTTGNDTWCTLADFNCLSGTTAMLHNITLALNPGDLTVMMNNGTTGSNTTGLSVAQVVYLKDGSAIGDSETIRVANFTTNTSMNILDGVTTAHANLTACYSGNATFPAVSRMQVPLGLSVVRVRVLFDNSADAAGSAVDVRARITETTAL